MNRNPKKRLKLSTWPSMSVYFKKGIRQVSSGNSPKTPSAINARSIRAKIGKRITYACLIFPFRSGMSRHPKR